MGEITAASATVTLSSVIEIVEAKRGVVTIRFGGVTHRVVAGGTFKVTLTQNFSAS